MHQLIDEIIETTSYFAHPYNLCEKEINEYTNILIHRYFPKLTGSRILTDEEIYELLA